MLQVWSEPAFVAKSLRQCCRIFFQLNFFATSCTNYGQLATSATSFELSRRISFYDVYCLACVSIKGVAKA